jgi:hypothetical protein
MRRKKNGESIISDAFPVRVTSSGETYNFLMEDLERVLQLEMIEKYEVSIKLEV